MKTYHLPSVHHWGETIERTFVRIGRWLSRPIKRWRPKLPAWKGKN
jgi:hypothetical protein